MFLNIYKDNISHVTYFKIYYTSISHYTYFPVLRKFHDHLTYVFYKIRNKLIVKYIRMNNMINDMKRVSGRVFV